MPTVYLWLIFISDVILSGFFILVLVGLIKTRKRKGNGITTGMILERGGLAIFWLWNIWLTIVGTSLFYEHFGNVVLLIRAGIGLFLVFAVIYTLLGD